MFPVSRDAAREEALSAHIDFGPHLLDNRGSWNHRPPPISSEMNERTLNIASPVCKRLSEAAAQTRLPEIRTSPCVEDGGLTAQFRSVA